MKVPFYDYTHTFLSNEKAIVDLFVAVGRRGGYIMQKELQEFEEALATYTGAEYAVGVGNATDAMEMFLMASGIQPGDEVIVCSHTMVATASAVRMAGAEPIPVDVASDGLMDVESARRAISAKTRAIMPTQLNGRTLDMRPIMALAEEHGLMLFEDSAQGLGSKFQGRSAGTFGIAGCLSFYPAKTLGCFGDGGAILCSDAGLYERLMWMRDHGRGADGDVHLWGRNSRLDNVQAAILHHFLRSFDEVVARRRALATLYCERLHHCPALQLPPAPDADDDHFDSYQNFEMLCDNRDGLKQALAADGIGTIVQWGGKGLHQFEKLEMGRDLPATDRWFEKCLMLPMNMSVSDEQAHAVADAVLNFYA